jgi:hypothetical protein
MPLAKPLFHLRDHEIGRPLDELSGRLTFAGLRDEVQDVIGKGGEGTRVEPAAR